MTSSFKLFENFMYKILYDEKIEAYVIAAYFWTRLVDEYKRKYSLVTANRCLIDNDSAMKLLTQIIHLRKFLPPSQDFIKELWENSTNDFRESWSSAPDEVLLLSNLLSNRLQMK